MEVIEKYVVTVDEVKVNVKIVGSTGGTKLYKLYVPRISIATMALIDDVRHQLVTDVEVNTTDILDPKVIETLKNKFKQRANDLIWEKLPSIKEETRKLLVGILINETLGLGKIEFLLNDGEL